MIGKKGKIGIKPVQLSVAVNVVAIAVILYLVLRRKKTEKGEDISSTPSIVESTKQEKDKILPQKIEEHPQQQRVIPVPKQQKLTRQQQQQSPYQLVRILQQELQLERNRNDLLQQKQAILQAQIHSLRRNTTNPQQDQQKLDLKNELQFCQMRLQQSLQSEAALRHKLSDYETMSISMLNHPEYLRLRQLCNTYKDTIAKLQGHLLARHDLKDHFLDLSFNNL